MGPNILSQVADVYRKLRFTLRFLLGNLADFDPAAHALPHADLPAVDRFTLAQFGVLLDDATAAYDGYQFARVYQVPGWASPLACWQCSKLDGILTWSLKRTNLW